ncbi:MAG: hypothetical protein VKJ02_15780 [Snowella sp.]|nr:hypothetical protein [Snowella sp.]
MGSTPKHLLTCFKPMTLQLKVPSIVRASCVDIVTQAVQNVDTTAKAEVDSSSKLSVMKINKNFKIS